MKEWPIQPNYRRSIKHSTKPSELQRTTFYLGTQDTAIAWLIWHVTRT